MSPHLVREEVAAGLPDAPIVVALGGGADSAVAAWACADHAKVRAVFVDHGLTGSETLGAAAARLADALGLDHTVLGAPVDDGPGLEERARDARWRAIREQCTDDEVVVTGHSKDDLAETVLINLLRGAGSSGLAAMAAPRSDVVRPLLGFRRAELRRHAETLGLPFVDDPANEDPGYLRNRIRGELVPHLEREYQPVVVDSLARAASHLAADDAVLEAKAGAIPIRRDGNALLIPAPLLTTIPRPMAARVVRRALRRLHPPYPGTAADVDSVLAVAAGEQRTATVTSSVTVATEGAQVALWAEPPAVPDAVELESPGSVRFGDRLVSAAPDASAALRPRSAVAVDPAVFAAGIAVRAAGVGERIDIAAGTKLVRDALAEAGIPRRLRPVWPVVANDAKIAAIIACRVAPWARPGGDRAVIVTQEPV